MYKLLIVDDNTTQIQSVIHFIDWKSLLVTEIKTATNGRDGVSVAQEFRPDIIITDVAMPLMNGIEMTATIKNLGLKSRFIYMSCYEDFDYVKQAIDHEVTGYILKPIDPTELLQAVRKVIEEINQNQKHENMDKLLQESLPIFRENFLYRLLYSRNFNLEEIRQNSQNLGYEAYRSFLVGKLQLSPQGLVPSELIDTYQILNVIKERMLKAPGIDCDVIIESRNNLILYLMGNQEDTELFLTAALAELKALSLYIQETFHTTVCIGLSNVHQLLIETPSMLMQASLAMENSFSQEGGFRLYGECDMADQEYDLSELKQDITDMFGRGSIDGIQSLLGKYYAADIPYGENYIKSLCFSIVNILQLIFIERHQDIKDILGPNANIWNKLSRFNTIVDTRQWLKNLLTAAIEYINETEVSKYERIVMDIKQHIDQNFQTISTVGQIVAELYISVSYAKSIFKKYTGETIFDYLLRRRMEAAIQLIEDPYIKIYEVAETIGYKSKTYFTETFKNYTGMTPSEYRKKSAKVGVLS